MYQPLISHLKKSHILALALSLPLLMPLAACAAKAKQPSPITHRQGSLPASGTVILRSGMQWMDETSPLFQRLQASLVPMLTQRGLQIAQAGPSTLAPMPHNPLPGEPKKTETSGTPSYSGNSGKPDMGAGDEEEAKKQAGELARQGKLAPLKLGRYEAPIQDSALPPSVLAVKPVDPFTILFALSQKQGLPLMRRGGPIPGHFPPEMTQGDASIARYVLVSRFTVVRPSYGGARLRGSAGGGVSASALSAVQRGSSGRGGNFSSPGHTPMAAGSVRGVGALGYGAPAPAAPPRPSYGGTPGDYARGYEGMSPVPGDPWHREGDLKARDYPLRNGPQPEYASPPAAPGSGGTAPDVTVPPALPSLPRPPLPGDADIPPIKGNQPRSGVYAPAPESPPLAALAIPGSGVMGFALELECYDLAPAKQGNTPVLVWKSVVQQRADSPDLASALPEMAATAMGTKEK